MSPPETKNHPSRTAVMVRKEDSAAVAEDADSVEDSEAVVSAVDSVEGSEEVSVEEEEDSEEDAEDSVEAEAAVVEKEAIVEEKEDTEDAVEEEDAAVEDSRLVARAAPKHPSLLKKRTHSKKLKHYVFYDLVCIPSF